MIWRKSVDTTSPAVLISFVVMFAPTPQFCTLDSMSWRDALGGFAPCAQICYMYNQNVIPCSFNRKKTEFSEKNMQIHHSIFFRGQSCKAFCTYSCHMLAGHNHVLGKYDLKRDVKSISLLFSAADKSSVDNKLLTWEIMRCVNSSVFTGVWRDMQSIT